MLGGRTGPLDGGPHELHLDRLFAPFVAHHVEPYAHHGSADNLLGRGADTARPAAMSAERHVTSQTPPAFLVHTDADDAVPAENSVAFYLALRKAHVPAELHVFEGMSHATYLASFPAPESREALHEIALFFDKHLER